jgi:lipopolysaccharide/colanic/teichoic acid biosynthesis glycosyltransferase
MQLEDAPLAATDVRPATLTKVAVRATPPETKTSEPSRPKRSLRAPQEHRVVPASWHIAKRATDICLATAGLCAFAPVLLVAVILICLSSPGSPLFVQTRVGRYGRRFSMYKLRTMVVDAHDRREELRLLNEATGPVFKMKRDPRVFPVGRWLRKLSIDEVPNLINVLLGDMSIVGPRPPLPSEVEQYDEFGLGRLRVKPGITCLWQIGGRSNVDFDRWMELDNQYVESWSALGDIEIILKTFPAVIFGKGAY